MLVIKLVNNGNDIIRHKIIYDEKLHKTTFINEFSVAIKYNKRNANHAESQMGIGH